MGAEQHDALTPEVLPPALSPTTAALVHPPRLAPKKRAFCISYLAHFNLRRAVADAGIVTLPGLRTSDPIRIGQVLLQEVAVQAYMRYLRDKDSLDVRPDASRIREEMVAIAFNDVGQALEFGPPDPNGFRPLRGIRLDKIDGRAIAGFKIREINGVQYTDIKFQPKVEVLKLLAQEAGMLSDEARLPPNVNIYIDLRSQE
jgi:Terminase small subunit